MTDIDIGNLGEGIFFQWCTEQAIIANKSIIDKRGWDYFIEFTRILCETAPSDVASEEIKCLVQIKTTREKHSQQISLSNWDYLVKAQMPSFVILIILENDNTPKDVLFLHVGETVIGNVLKRLRETKRHKLHKAKMSIPYKETTSLDQPFGESIRELIIYHIGPSIANYISKKSSWISEIGYSNPRNKLSFQTSATPDELADFTIGLTEINVSKVLMSTNIRFDIPEDIKEFNSGTIQATPDGKDIEIGFQEKDGIEIKLKAKLYKSISYLYGKKLPIRIRIKSDNCEIFFKENEDIVFNFSFNMEAKPYKFNELVKLSSLITILTNTDHDIVFTIYDTIPHDLKLSRDRLKTPFPIDDNIISTARLICLTNKIVQHYGIDPFFNSSAEEIALQSKSVFEIAYVNGIKYLRTSETDKVIISTINKLEILYDIYFVRMSVLSLGIKRIVIKYYFLFNKLICIDEKEHKYTGEFIIHIIESRIENSNNPFDGNAEYKKLQEDTNNIGDTLY